MIRRANAIDALDSLIADVAIPGLGTVRAREIVDDAVSAGECLVYATPEGDVAGLVITAVGSFYGRDFIRLIVVSPNHRRSGIGAALMQSAASQATTEVVFTSTNESNFTMRQLLTRNGWTFSGALTGLDEGDPELVFWTAEKGSNIPLGDPKQNGQSP